MTSTIILIIVLAALASGSLGAWIHSFMAKVPAGVVSTVETEFKSVELSIEQRAASELHTLAGKLMDTSTEQAVIAAAKADIAKAEASIAAKVKALSTSAQTMMALATTQAAATGTTAS